VSSVSRVLVAIACALAVAGPAESAATHVANETARNRAIITSFADLFYTQRRVQEAFDRYVSPDYIQHNPGLTDGREAAVMALKPMFSSPGATFEVKRILVDGNMAAIHLFGRGDPKTAGAAVVDLYRLKDGKIVEHWDVIQPFPASSKNAHPMF